MTAFVIHYLIMSALVSAVLAAYGSDDIKEFPKRALRTWTIMVIVGTLAALAVEIGQRPAILF